MYAALYIPNFGLQALLRHRLEEAAQPAVLLEADAVGAGLARRSGKDRGKARILELNPAAAAHGVEAGMTASQGQARFPGLRLMNRSADEENAARSALLSLGASFSAWLEDTAPGVCTVDLSGTESVVTGRFEALGQEALAGLQAANLEGSVGLAPNPDLALLAAQTVEPGQWRILRHAEEAREFLATLPLVETLHPSAELREILKLWGLRTLGDFTRLPRDAVRERLGEEALELWDQAAGRRERPLRLVQPPRDFVESMELEYEVETLEPLLFILRRFLEQLMNRLRTVYLVCAELRLTLSFADHRRYERSLRVPEPSRDIDQLFRILHSHLETVQAEAAIIGLQLEALPSAPPRRQLDLFESSLRDPHRFSETLARLEGLVGSERAGTPEILPGHQPDGWRMHGFHEDGLPLEQLRPPQPKPNPGQRRADPLEPEPVCLGVPWRRFRPPVPLQVAAEPLSEADEAKLAVKRERETFFRAQSGEQLELTLPLESGTGGKIDPIKVPEEEKRKRDRKWHPPGGAPPPRMSNAATLQPQEPVMRPQRIMDGPVTGEVIAARGPYLISGHWWEHSRSWSSCVWEVEVEVEGKINPASTENSPVRELLRIELCANNQWHLTGICR